MTTSRPYRFTSTFLAQCLYSLCALIALALPAALTSCSEAKECEDIVPADARAILSIQSGRACSLTGRLGLPALPNIAPHKQAYAFITADGYYALTLPLADNTDSLHAALQGASADLTARGRSDALSWAWWRGSWLVMAGEKALTIAGPALGLEERGRLTGLMQRLYRKSTPGMSEGKLYATLNEDKAPAGSWALVAQLSALPAPVQGIFSALFLPKGIEAGDAVIQSHTQQDGNNEFSIVNRISAPDSSRQSLLNNAVAKGRKISGRMALATGAVMELCINASGNELAQRLKENKSTRTLFVGLGDIVDVDRILNSINGDIQLSLSPTAGGFDDVPPFCLTADCSDPTLISAAKDWEKRSLHKKNRSVERQGDTFVFRFGEKKEKYLLFTPPTTGKKVILAYGSAGAPAPVPKLPEEQTGSLNNTNVKGLAYWARLNLGTLGTGQGNNGEASSVISLLDKKFGKMELRATDAAHFSISFAQEE